MIRPWACLVVLALVAAAPAHPAGAAEDPEGFRLVEATVASVNGEVIFLTDLDRETCLFRCGAYAGESPKELAPAAVRDRMIADVLVLQEQTKLGLGEVDNSVLASAVEEGMRRMAACGAPCAKTISRPDVQTFVSRRLLVKEFFAKRVGVFIEVGDEDVERELRRRAPRGDGAPGPADREAVRAELLQERTDREIRNWFERAASKARIVVSPLERP